MVTMFIAECEAMAVRMFLQTIRENAAARPLEWKGAIVNEQADHRFSRYGSEFEIRASDGVITKASCVPLFKDGRCVQTEDSMGAAFVAAISETALAVGAPLGARRILSRSA